MVFLSRDDLPQNWFEQRSEEWLHWTPDGEFLRSHTVTQNLGKSFVHQMEQILDSYKTRSGLCAKIRRPFTVVPHQEVLRQMGYDEEEEEQPSQSPAGFSTSQDETSSSETSQARVLAPLVLS
jgi:hypothetical protein